MTKEEMMKQMQNLLSFQKQVRAKAEAVKSKYRGGRGKNRCCRNRGFCR